MLAFVRAEKKGVKVVRPFRSRRVGTPTPFENMLIGLPELPNAFMGLLSPKGHHERAWVIAEEGLQRITLEAARQGLRSIST